MSCLSHTTRSDQTKCLGNGEAVPVHATKAHGEVELHLHAFLMSYNIEMSGKLHALATLPSVPTEKESVGLHSQSRGFGKG